MTDPGIGRVLGESALDHDDDRGARSAFTSLGKPETALDVDELQALERRGAGTRVRR
ncbi:MAG: hypothetical protein OXU39_12465 [Gemmatimonadota bacterium]|nr:hypothetical protein [Gemmatimonadota bacterium]MDE3006895.1 hypothetical protein [Gemmatimonadota bacterium]